MFEHIVIFRFKEPLSPEKQTELVGAILEFREQIPGIVGLSAGINETEEVQNIHDYTLGLRITFEDRDALKGYLPHPAHQAFVQWLDGLVESVVVMDYPVEAREVSG
ncbi:Dabb family protein [Deinococcus hopiensis]|uniref:Stress responsive A/B Barrel Domain n=1 Tax=Deinococcus hopiensis KR-140 TaxID=695939 RepID=A0A1W1VUG1_9DEIO|nr:Dabb family protein [Deinococcus hopiensis]SMB97005.1 Stress responsive A/B Barrel Domain [Deinococcus hopiensis KR-140]